MQTGHREFGAGVEGFPVQISVPGDDAERNWAALHASKTWPEPDSIIRLAQVRHEVWAGNVTPQSLTPLSVSSSADHGPGGHRGPASPNWICWYHGSFLQ
eukprot:2086084-Rhodomonas_salina.5